MRFVLREVMVNTTGPASLRTSPGVMSGLCGLPDEIEQRLREDAQPTVIAAHRDPVLLQNGPLRHVPARRAAREEHHHITRT